jgi:hypothetical protein
MNYKTKTMEEVRERRKFVYQGMMYSAQRLDLLVVSICGAGIYIYFELLKYLTKEEMCTHWSIKLFAVLFLFGLLTNFISQHFALRSHYYDFLNCQEQIDFGDKPTKEQEESINKSEYKSDNHEKFRKWFDLSSIGLMFFGLTTLMTYFLFIF